MTEISSQSTGEELGRQEGQQEAFPVVLKASRSHMILTLVGTAFLCFEFVFLNLYFDRSWFGMDLRVYGVPIIILSLVLAHFLLTIAESNRVCRWFALIFKGRPLVVYRKWLTLNEDGIMFGIKPILYSAIDELELTLLGNLVFKSRSVCGAKAAFPDKVLKIPFPAADFATQDVFLAAIQKHKPNLLMNKRLASGRKNVMQQGAQATQLVSAAIMALLLFDVGFSSFYYLDLLKNFYLAETDLLDKKPAEAADHFAKAEDLRLHPLPFSWVSSKFLKSSNVAAGIWEERARVLWLQGKHDDAIADGVKAIAESPTNLRHRLFQTRMLVDENKIPEAKEQLNKILEDHKHSFMPRLYLLAISKVQNKGDQGKVDEEYKTQLDPCFADTYVNEPHWPPGGNTFFTELFYSEDSRFLLDRFLGSKYEPPPADAQVSDSAKK